MQFNYCTCIHRKAILLFNWGRVYQAVRMMRLQGNKSPKKARRRRQENVLTQVIVYYSGMPVNFVKPCD